MRRFFVFAGFVLLAAVIACGRSTPPAVRDPFIAFAADFRGYQSWKAIDVSASATPGPVHPQTKIIEYINRFPDAGADEFPVGTIIVKRPTDAQLDAGFFGMVKRGGGFNAQGAKDWEWYEISDIQDGTNSVKIVWSGVGPPQGESYGGDPHAGCNSCHAACLNDAVCAPEMTIDKL